MLTAERLRELLDYDPETGVFRWRKTTGGRPAGTVAGTLKPKGHLAIGVDGGLYLAHRLAWLYFYGEWPNNQIDHKDNRPAHNAINNLRDVTGSLNCQNQTKAHKRTSTGFLGVHPKKNRFQASIRVNGSLVHLGSFKTPEEAHAAYIAAKRQKHEGNTL